MTTYSRRLFTVMIAATCVALSLALPSRALAADEVLTFFGWSDQHVKVDGTADHLLPAIDAMNSLPGTKFPEAIGGTVGKPAFVFGCGDITEWPTNAAKDAYNKLITGRLKFPAYDIVGNHDEGGKVPSETLTKWIISRHGALSYTFDKGGVHFVALFSKYDDSLDNPAQPITKEALDFLRKDLAKVPKATPVIVATHLCLDAITNKNDFVEALGGARVILVLGGHYHKAQAAEYHGIRFLQLPSPAPNGQREFTVVRVSSNRLIAIPYDYQKKQWDESRGKTLDVPLQGGAK